MRAVPTVPALPVQATEGSAATRVWEFDLTALTPIYKGGARPDGVDEGRPFRGPSIRGALRAAWRMIQPVTTSAELRELELERFGGISPEPVASRVRVGVLSQTSVASASPPNMQYATWPAQGAPHFHGGAAGRVRVEAPAAFAQEIHNALQVWLLTGGLGSRVRRGLGQLTTEDATLVPPFESAGAYLARLRALAPEPAARPWPSLAGVRVLVLDAPRRTAPEALTAALDGFRHARAMRSLGGRRFSGDDRAKPFQDDWLAVRDRRNIEGWAPSLGMPVAYGSTNGHYDGKLWIGPFDRGADRMPSPVLVRTVPLMSGRFVPALVLLRHWVVPQFSGANRRAQHSVRGTVRVEVLDVLATHLTTRMGWTEL